MKTWNLKIVISIVFALLLTTNLVSAQNFQYKQERALAKIIFKSLQDEDLESFSKFCITEKRMSQMLDEMDATSEKDKSIKKEISEVKASDMRNEAISGFNKSLVQAKSDAFNLKESKFPELGFYKTRFEMLKVKCITVKVDISTDKVYMMVIEMFKTNDDIFIYDFKIIKGGVY